MTETPDNHSDEVALEIPTLDSIKIEALRLALTILSEPDETRQTRVTSEIAQTIARGPHFVCGINGYLLWNFVQSLITGYGGVAGAIDEVTRVLAAAVLESEAGPA